MSKVTLRSRPIGKERKSLYLDIYPPVRNPQTGKLQRKFYLELFTYGKPRQDFERAHNRETMELAINVAAQRQLDVQNEKYGFLSKRMRQGNFVEYFEAERKKRGNASSLDNWKNAIKYFKAFAGEVVRFSELTEAFSEEFAAYLLSGPNLNPRGKKIGVNTAVAYFAKYRATLDCAHRDGYLTTNLYDLVEPIEGEAGNREFLFLNELQILADTPCTSNLIKRASLFACLTGLRFSDVKGITWEEIRGDRGNYYIQFAMEKTGVSLFHPIADQAYDLLGVPGIGQIFKCLDYSKTASVVPQWVASAGISKRITFHCFRNTFATLQLLAGTDITTVSKLLGHKFLQTTMIYVKIVDKLKRDASHRIEITVNSDWQNVAKIA